MTTQQLENSHLVPVYGKREISLVRGEGMSVYDEEGTEYLDCMMGVGAVILGYGHPVYTSALTEQLGQIISTHSSFYSPERAKLLEALVRILPEPLSHSFISSTGTEAVEAAIKFARLHTGKPGVISAKRAYHGRSLGSLSISGNPKYKKAFEPLLDFMKQVSFNEIGAIEEALTDDIGAVILEPIQGEAGVFIPDENYLKQVREFCDENSLLLIFDEVQSGFRTGSWLASMQYGVTPDIVTISKALGNGFPVAVTATTSEIAASIPKGSHGTTFGANPLACRAARTTIELIERQGLLELSKQRGQYFLNRLQEIDSPVIREVRAKGLFVGVELKKKSGLFAKAMQEDHQVLVMTTGTVIRFLPALTVTEEQIDRAVRALSVVLSKNAV